MNPSPHRPRIAGMRPDPRVLRCGLAIGMVYCLASAAIAAVPSPPPAEAESVTETPVEPPVALPIVPLATFEERRHAVLEGYARDGRERFLRAAVLFELGRKDEALKEVNRGLDAMVPGNKENRWMHGGNTGFIAWPGLDCYIRYEQFLDAATKERYRSIYTGAVFYARLSTSNHKLMAATSRYLATQIWGAEAFHTDPFFLTDEYIMKMQGGPTGKAGWGTFFSKEDPTGEKYLQSMIVATVEGGPGEYASRPYGAQNILPILTLADCSKDPVMRERARIAYEVCLIQLAPAWLRGHLATFAPRSYPDTETQQPWGVATLPWLYFGGVTPNMASAGAAVRAATDRYRLPAILQPAGTDRSKPYFYRALINGWALDHYINRTYALFSRSAKVGGRPFSGQSYPCGVMWEEPDPGRGSHLWITNPAADEPGQMGLHTHGVRGSEQELLARDSLLFVFGIAHGNAFPYALGYVPGGYRASINGSAGSGKIFLHYGSVLIAITASQPFEWNPGAGIRAPASKPRPGDSEFRITAPECAVALETAPPDEFPGTTPQQQLDAFRKAILAKSAIRLTASNPPTARYTNRHGDTLDCALDGDDRIDGVVVDYKNWPFMESPWTNRQGAHDPLVVTDGKTKRKYDFETWSVTESDKIETKANPKKSTGP